MAKIIPNSYNGWDPLKQVILGSSYTPEFFDDIKAVGVQPKGRFNDQIIILKAF